MQDLTTICVWPNAHSDEDRTLEATFHWPFTTLGIAAHFAIGPQLSHLNGVYLQDRRHLIAVTAGIEVNELMQPLVQGTQGKRTDVPSFQLPPPLRLFLHSERIVLALEPVRCAVHFHSLRTLPPEIPQLVPSTPLSLSLPPSPATWLLTTPISSPCPLSNRCASPRRPPLVLFKGACYTGPATLGHRRRHL